VLVLGATARTKVISVRILILLKFPALVVGVGRAKRGFGGRDGNEIDPHLVSNTVLPTQTFFSDYWCLRSSLIPCHGRLELGLALTGVYFGSCVLTT